MKYQVTHSTLYTYSEPISMSHNILHLRPRDLAGQKCLEFDLRIEPSTSELRQHLDSFGNLFHFVSNDESHSIWNVQAISIVEVDHPPILPTADRWRDVVNSSTFAPDLMEFKVTSPHCPVDPKLADYALPSFDRYDLLWDAVNDLMHRIHRDFKFDSTATYVGISPLEVMELRRGVCQDFSHLMIACLRSMGIPSRYVSGHLRTIPPPGQPRLIGADATHAWIAVYFPSCGWIDFDPTNAVVPGNDHITVAWARDFDDVTPVKGVVVGHARHSLSISVDVEPLAEV